MIFFSFGLFTIGLFHGTITNDFCAIKNYFLVNLFFNVDYK